MRLAVYRILRMKPAKDNPKTGFVRERLFRRIAGPTGTRIA